MMRLLYLLICMSLLAAPAQAEGGSAVPPAAVVIAPASSVAPLAAIAKPPSAAPSKLESTEPSPPVGADAEKLHKRQLQLAPRKIGLLRATVKATMVEPWPGISTATTLSRDPPACGFARFTNEAMATTTRTTPIAISSILRGGRFRFAVPNSSPMLIVGPAGGLGGAGIAAFGGGGGAGV